MSRSAAVRGGLEGVSGPGVPAAKGFVLGEGRVDADQVYGFGVEAAEKGEVVGDVDAAVDGVEGVGFCGHSILRG